MLPDPGANDGPLGPLPAGRHLHVAGYALLRDGPRASALAAIADARAAGMTVSVDPSSWALLYPGAIPAVDLLLPNEEEAALAGAAPEVVTKLGPGGARWSDGSETITVPAEPVEVVDTHRRRRRVRRRLPHRPVRRRRSARGARGRLPRRGARSGAGRRPPLVASLTRESTFANGDPGMPEAVIVDAIRTPIGRAAKGSLKDVRTDDLAAIPLKALVERNPGRGLLRDRRRDDGLRLPDGRGGLQHRPQRRAAGRARPSHPGHDGQPLLRLLAADDPDGLPRDQGRRGRPVHRRRRRGRLALPGAGAVRPALAARRLRRRAVQRLHPDGAHGRERRQALQRQPRGAGRVGGDLAEPRGRGARVRPLRPRDRRREHARRRGRA